MLGANCNVELSEVVLIEHRNSDETEECMVLVSSRDASSSGVDKVIEDGSRLYSNSSTTWSKRHNPHTPVQVGSHLVLTPCL